MTHNSGLKRITIFFATLITCGFSFCEEQVSLWKKVSEPAFGIWGAGPVVRAPNYKGADPSLAASMYIFGGYGPIAIEANRFSWSFYRDGTWFASLVGQIRTQHQRAEERNEGLKERSLSFETGAQIGRRFGDAFTARLSWVHDVSGEHNSHEWDLQAYRRDQWGNFRLLSTIGVQYQDANLVDYYYGQDGITFPTMYKADNEWVLEIELLATYPLGDHWSIFTGTRNYAYSNSIKESPIADGKVTLQVFTGIGRRF